MVVKDTYSAPRIRELNFNECWNYISMHVLKDIALKGIPDEKIPSKEVTDDILNMICTKYANLSPVEVALALQMDRYGEFENKEKHYMFYGTEYVGNILKMYCQYKTKIARDFNLERKTNLIEEKVNEEERDREYLESLLTRISSGEPFHEINAYLYYEKVPEEFRLSDAERFQLYQNQLRKVNAEFRNKQAANKEEFTSVRLKQFLEQHKQSAEQRAKFRTANIITCRYLKRKYHLTINEFKRV